MADKKTVNVTPVPTDKDENRTAAASANGAAAKSGMLPVLIIGIALIAASSAVTFFAVKISLPKSIGAEQKKPAEKSSQHGGGHGKPAKSEDNSLLVPIKEVIVNATGTHGTRMVNIVPTIVASDSELTAELKANEALVRDRIGSAMVKLSIDELEGLYGRDNLKKAIVAALNESFQPKGIGTVTDVYLSDFLIQ